MHYTLVVIDDSRNISHLQKPFETNQSAASKNRKISNNFRNQQKQLFRNLRSAQWFFQFKNVSTIFENLLFPRVSNWLFFKYFLKIRQWFLKSCVTTRLYFIFVKFCAIYQVNFLRIFFYSRY